MSEPEAVVSAPEVRAADADFDAAMRAELDRRIAALAEAGDASFGSIGRGEWALTVLVTILIPLLVVWVFA